ncbi:MAG: AMP-binding protein [Eubacteriales bacterium]|nr:AMP-binding protein [Eubacteriales bacterium]
MATIIDTPWMKHYDPWFQPTLDYPDTTLFEQFADAAKQFPDYPALTFFGHSQSYHDVLLQVEQAATALSVIGFKPGQVATICLPNVPQAVIFFYAVNRLGGICNMVHPLSPPEELRHYLKTAQSDILIILDAMLTKHVELLAAHPLRKTIVCSIMDYLHFPINLGFYLTKGRKIKPIPHAEVYVRWPDFMQLGQVDSTDVFTVSGNYTRQILPDDCAVYLHSGGTTGEPKTIMLSSKNFNILAYQGPQVIGSPRDEKYDPKGLSMVMILPLFHGFGLCMGMHTMLTNGMRCILVPLFSADVLADIIVKEKPTFIAAVPTLFEGILQNKKLKNADLSCLKAVFCGGDTLTSDLKQRFDDFIKARAASCFLREGYGLTETVTVCAVNPQLNSRPDTVGLPLADVLMKVINPETQETVPNGQHGEFCIHAPTRMIGYLNDPEATAQTIRIHADGRDWVHTGDFGFMDDDGYFHFRQRMKRILKVSGIPVFPSQVEDVISSVPGVRLACAIGVPHPYKMQVVKAFVVAEDPKANRDELKNQIISRCETALIAYAIPKEIEFRDDLPRTKVGKIDFIELERQELAIREA